MIGTDYSDLLLLEESKVGQQGYSVAVITKLGLVLLREKSTQIQSSQCSHLMKNTLSKSLERFWQTCQYETLPKFNPNFLAPEQRRARHILETTTMFEYNLFEIGMLWKKNMVLRFHMDLAVKRLLSLGKEFL